MNCCTTIRTDTGRLFSWLAALHRLRFRLFGFEKTQRQLIDGIKQAGVSGVELLEIGCGPGYLHIPYCSQALPEPPGWIWPRGCSPISLLLPAVYP